MKLHVTVCPVRSGQFSGLVYSHSNQRNVVAMTLPTSDRNVAARAGMVLRSLLG